VDQIHDIDPQSKEEVPLFHPRKQKWQEHFRWREDGIYINGLTAIGARLSTR